MAEANIDIGVRLVPKDLSGTIEEFTEQMMKGLNGIDINKFAEKITNSLNDAISKYKNPKFNKTIADQLINAEQIKNTYALLKQLEEEATAVNRKLEIPKLNFTINNKTIQGIEGIEKEIELLTKNMADLEKQSKDTVGAINAAIQAGAKSKIKEFRSNLTTTKNNRKGSLKSTLEKNDNLDKKKEAINKYIDAQTKYEAFVSGINNKQPPKVGKLKNEVNDIFDKLKKPLTSDEKNILNDYIEQQFKNINFKDIQKQLSVQLKNAFNGINIDYDKIANGAPILKVGQEFDEQIKFLENENKKIDNLNRSIQGKTEDTATLTEQKSINAIDKAINIFKMNSLYEGAGVSTHKVEFGANLKDSLNVIMKDKNIWDKIETQLISNIDKGYIDVEDKTISELQNAYIQINEAIQNAMRSFYINSEGESIMGVAYDSEGNEYELTDLISKKNEIINILKEQGQAFDVAEDDIKQYQKIMNNIIRVNTGKALVFSSGYSDNENDVGTTSEETTKLKHDYNEMSASIENYKSQIEELTAKMQEYKALADNSNEDKSKLSNMESELATLNKQYDASIQKLNEYKKKIEELEAKTSGVINDDNTPFSSVNLGEDEQVIKTSDLEVFKRLAESIKNLQERMTQAEKILAEVPKGMDGLKQLSSQIQKMSGNFNEDGSIKDLGVTAESLSEQLKHLDEEFDKRLEKKISELEKKSSKNGQPDLTESLNELRVVVDTENVTPDIKLSDNTIPDISGQLEHEAIEVEEQVERIKTAESELNDKPSINNEVANEEQHIKKLEELRTVIESDIDSFEELKQEIESCTSHKDFYALAKQMRQLDEEIKQTVASYNELSPEEPFSTFGYNQANNDHTINAISEQRKSLKESEKEYSKLQRIADTYQKTLNKRPYDNDYSGRLERLKTLQQSYEEILAIIEQLKKNNQWMPGTAEQIHIKDKEYNKNISLGNSIETLDKTKGIEALNSYNQAIQNSEQTFEKYKQNINEIANLKITNKDEYSTAVANLNTYNKEFMNFYVLYSKAVKKFSLPNDLKNEMDIFGGKAIDLSENFKKALQSINNTKRERLTKGATDIINAAQKHFIEANKEKILESPEEVIAETNTSSKIDNIKNEEEAHKENTAAIIVETEAAQKLENIKESQTDVATSDGSENNILSEDIPSKINEQQEVNSINAVDTAIKDLTQHIENKNKAIADEAIAMKNAATSEVADLERVREKVTEVKNSISDSTATPAGKIIMPDNSEISVSKTSNGDTALLAGEISAVNNLKDAFTNTKTAIVQKNNAITAEAEIMTATASSEVSDITKVSDAVHNLSEKIVALPKVNVVGELNTGAPVNITFNYDNAQIAAIRERINTEFNASNPVPIDFSPNVISLRQQIEEGLQKIPVTVDANNQKVEISNATVVQQAVISLKDEISKQLTDIRIQSFTISESSRDRLKSDLENILSNVGLAFDTDKISKDIKKAIQAASDEAKKKIKDGETNKKETKKTQNTPSEKLLENYNKLKNKLAETERLVKKSQSIGYNREFKDDFKVILNDMNALGNADTTKKDALTEWMQKTKQILKNWNEINAKIENATKYRVSTSSRTSYAEAAANGSESSYRRGYATTKTNEMKAWYDNFTNNTGSLTKEQLEAINNKYHELYDYILKIAKRSEDFTEENLSKIDQERHKLSQIVEMFKSANSGTGDFKIDLGRINNVVKDIELKNQNNQNSELNARIEALKNKMAEYSEMNKNVGGLDYTGIQKYAQVVSDINSLFKQIQETNRSIQTSTRNDNAMNKTSAKMDDLIFKMKQFVEQNSRILSDAGMKSQYEELLRRTETLPRTAANWQMMTKEFNAFKSAVTSKGLTGRSVGDELKFIFEKIGIKAILGNQIYRIIGYFRQMVSIIQEIDTGMTNLKRVSSETEVIYNKFLSTSVKQAKELGSTMTAVIDATSSFSRLGYSLNDANELAKNAIMYSNVGWIDTETATNDIVSTMKAFNIEAKDSIKIVDTFDILGNKFALSSADVGAGLKESASALATANNTMEESAAMITAITEITQDSASAGNALKTNFYVFMYRNMHNEHI